MCLKITYVATAKYPENFFNALKPGQNKKSYIFQEIGIPKIYVQLFENFQNLIALQVWCLAFTKNVEWLINGQNSQNSSGGKICKKKS